jgi:hypothetical protein
MTRVPAHGRAAPPQGLAERCPDVPPTTWKLNIWAAKMNAAVTPIRGMARSSNVSFVRLTA